MSTHQAKQLSTEPVTSVFESLRFYGYQDSNSLFILLLGIFLCYSSLMHEDPSGHVAILYNVVSTSMQRHAVASTLRRRCINVVCPLG